MKKYAGAIAGLILGASAVSANAADLPGRAVAPAYVAVPVFTWTGFYAGLNAGASLAGDYNWNINSIAAGGAGIPVDIRGRNRVGGALVGGTLGYNYQFGNWVVGVEGDIGYTSIGSKSSIGLNSVAGIPVGIGISGRTETDSYLGTVRGRVGYAMGQWLFYGTGGWAFTESTMGVSLGSLSLNSTRALNGYTAGAGVEYAVTPALSVKAEYLYADFNKGRFNYTIPLGGLTLSASARGGFDTHLLKLGVNYKFTGW